MPCTALGECVQAWHVPVPPKQVSWPSNPAEPALDAQGHRVTESGYLCLPLSGAAPLALLHPGNEELQRDPRLPSPLWDPLISVDEKGGDCIPQRLLLSLCSGFMQTDREPRRMRCSLKGRQNKPQHCGFFLLKNAPGKRN